MVLTVSYEIYQNLTPGDLITHVQDITISRMSLFSLWLEVGLRLVVRDLFYFVTP